MQNTFPASGSMTNSLFLKKKVDPQHRIMMLSGISPLFCKGEIFREKIESSTFPVSRPDSICWKSLKESICNRNESLTRMTCAFLDSFALIFWIIIKESESIQEMSFFFERIIPPYFATWDLWVLGFSDWIGAYDLSPHSRSKMMGAGVGFICNPDILWSPFRN